MSARLGKRQLWLLANVAGPFTLLIVGDRVSRSLCRRGLLAPYRDPDPEARGGKGDDGSFFGITPAGLRALAAAMERGDLAELYDPRFRPDHVRLYWSARGRGPGENRSKGGADG